MTSKQRASLKKIAQSKQAAFQIGKNAISPELVQAIDDYLEVHEIIKINVLNNCEENAKNLADTISGRTRSRIVQIIGKKIILYRQRTC